MNVLSLNVSLFFYFFLFNKMKAGLNALNHAKLRAHNRKSIQYLEFCGCQLMNGIGIRHNVERITENSPESTNIKAVIFGVNPWSFYKSRSGWCRRAEGKIGYRRTSA